MTLLKHCLVPLNIFLIEALRADINRTVLLIPALCGTLSEEVITGALKQASQNDLEQWEKKNISYTVRKQRQAFFNGDRNPKNGELLCDF